MSVGQAKHFIYSPLPSSRCIRLVKLNDRRSAESISFSLLTTHFDEHPPYLALSYTWGDPRSPCFDLLPPLPTKPVETRCDGQPFYVEPNLSAALECLSSLLQDRPDTYFWIDAICINQGDDIEKVSQVKMMGEIYSRAQRVYSWLGPKDETSDEALFILRQFAKPSYATIKRAAGNVDFQYPETYSKKLGIQPFPIGYWFSLGALMQRSYFERVWILQEVVHAADVIFLLGSSQFTITELQRTVVLLSEFKWIQFLRPAPLSMAMKSRDEFRHQVPKKYEPMIAKSLLAVTWVDHMSQLPFARIQQQSYRDSEPDSIDFKRLLKSHRQRQATDPRDKIFALISLAKASVYPYATKAELEMIVDYSIPCGRTRDWASVNLYTQLAWKFIQSDQSLQFLNLKEDEAVTKLRGLPSWVPDWSSGLLNCSPLPEFSTRPWNATGRLTPRIQRKDDMLQVRGLRLGVVAQTSVVPENITVNSTARFQSFISIISALPVVTSHGLSRLHLFSAACLLDEFGGKIPAPPDLPYLFLAFIIRHLSRVWYQREIIANYETLDFEIPLPRGPPPFQGRFSKLFKRKDSLLPDFINPLTAPWLELVLSEGSVNGLKLSILNDYLKGASYKSKISPWLNIEPIIQRFPEALSNKRLIRIDCLMLGIAPPSVRCGDEVWILAGGPTPYFLRKRENGNYMLLGEAYVQGAMFGESAVESKLVDLVLE